jgi:hypothetical protein
MQRPSTRQPQLQLASHDPQMMGVTLNPFHPVDPQLDDHPALGVPRE